MTEPRVTGDLDLNSGIWVMSNSALLPDGNGFLELNCRVAQLSEESRRAASALVSEAEAQFDNDDVRMLDKAADYYNKENALLAASLGFADTFEIKGDMSETLPGFLDAAAKARVARRSLLESRRDSWRGGVRLIKRRRTLFSVYSVVSLD